MDKDSFSAASAIALNAAFGDRPLAVDGLLDRFPSAESIFTLPEKERGELFDPYGRVPAGLGDSALKAAEEEYRYLKALGVRIVSIFDKEEYPPLLRECPDAPILLYVRSGRTLKELFGKGRSVSVVGTRAESCRGEEWCRRMVRAIADRSREEVIVSGLAIGVDISAHLAAMAYGLPTVAVIPVGADDIYPRRHSLIADKIVGSGGAVITDYPPGTQPRPYNFLRRNRIIAGISPATVLVESKVKGGGMMTCRLAAGYGRMVYAMQGRIDDALSEGCNALIAEKVAEPVVSLDSLCGNLGLASGARPRLTLEERVRERLGAAADETVLAVCREIASRTGMDVEELASRLDLSYSCASRVVGLLESEGIVDTDVLRRCSINVNFH